MMNKQKSSKAGLWKVATFLPLLALLLMAFGKTGESVNLEKKMSPQIVSTGFHDSVKELNKADVQQKDSIQAKEKVYTIVEINPVYPGGDKALSEYLDNNTYPANSNAKHIQGKVYLNFVINKEGKVTNITVLKSSKNPELDAEAIRLVRQMPTWTPGKEKGLPVSVLNTVRVNFVLTPESSNNSKVAPPPLPPNKDSHLIWLKNNGKVGYNEVETQIDELTEKVKSELQKNPELQLDILIEEGKIDERVDQITNILKVNGNPKVRYLSFHVEEGTDSKGLMWSKISSKPMNIK